MAWIDKLQPGSFRGIPFKIESHEFGSGRRKINHEFPQRNKTRSEDLGKKTQLFLLELLIIGDDYFSDRNKLLDALEGEGSGELIHPYLGKKNVQVGPFSLSETVKEGRIARFSVEFSESGKESFPEKKTSGKEKTLTGILALLADANTFLEDGFSVANSPAHVVEGAENTVLDTLDFMETSVAAVTQPVASLTALISDVKSEAGSLIRSPFDLANSLASTFTKLLDVFSGDPETSGKIFSRYTEIDNEFEAISPTTPSANRKFQNQNTLINYSKQQAFASQANAAVNREFISSSGATEERDIVVANLTTQLNVIDLPDTNFQSIKTVQAAITETLPDPTTGELITFTPKKTLPALVISYDLFENLEKEDEIIEENDISHPGFVPGGVPLQVSSG